MAVLTRIRATADLLVVVEAAHQVLVLLSLGLRQVMEAMAEPLLCTTELTTEVAVVVRRVPQVRMAHLTRAEAVVLLLLQVAATGLLVQPRHRHRWALLTQVAVEVAAKILWVDMRERRVVRAW
jgi:hypothetical protein